MTDGDLLARLLPLVLQRYNVSDFEADVLQNARRERQTRRLKAKRFKRFSQRKAISISRYIISQAVVFYQFFLRYVRRGQHGHAALVYTTQIFN